MKRKEKAMVQKMALVVCCMEMTFYGILFLAVAVLVTKLLDLCILNYQPKKESSSTENYYEGPIVQTKQKKENPLPFHQLRSIF